MRLFSRTALAAALLAGTLVAAPGAVAEPPPDERPPAGSYDERHLLVTFAPGTPGAARAAAHAAEGAREVNRFDWLNTDVVEVRDNEDAADVAPRYARNPNVVNTDLNWKYSIDGMPNDLLFKELWGLHNIEQPVTGSLVRGKDDVDIDAPEGWTTAFPEGAFPNVGGTRVGIVDSGIDQTHADLLYKTKACATALTGRGIITPGVCADDNSHGTHVAGTVGATANNTTGVAGVAPNAEYAIFKALNSSGLGFLADVVAGIHWLHTTGGAGIINMSLGSPYPAFTLAAEVVEAAEAGTLLIAAAGNSGGGEASYPAAYADVMSVAAVNAAGATAWFSTCNGDVEINAPGEDIWSTLPGNTYAPFSGTSMAAPHVSGVAAMIKHMHPSFSAADIRTQLKNTAASPQGHGGCNDRGIVNLDAAVAGGGDPPPPPTELGAIAGAVTGGGKEKGPISGATVDCPGAGSTTTGEDGAYSLVDVTPGSYDCTASKPGYRSKTATVTVQSGQTTTQNFRLQPGRQQ